MTNRSTTSQRWVLALTSTAALMVALDQLVVATALSKIRDDLHASIATLDWTVGAYSLSFAVLLIPGTALGDRFGRRRLFLVGLGVFTLASAACALAPNATLLIAARAVQGGGSALVLPLAVALLTAAYPVEKRAPVVGLFTAFTGLAVLGGPVVGGAVTEGIAWQWIFWINIPIGAAVIPLVAARMSESYGPRSRIDLCGLVLATGGMFGLVWGIIRADDAGWTSAEVLGMLTGGTILTVGFVRWELRTREPMLPMHLFRVRTFAAANTATLLLTASLFGTVFFFAQYLQVSLGYGPLEAGVRLLPWTATLFVVAPMAGVLGQRIGGRPLLVVGLTMQSAGMAWVAYNIAQQHGYASSLAAFLITGSGTSMALPSAQNAVMNSVPAAFLGKASGTYNMVRQLGAVIGVAVLSAVFSSRGGFATPGDFDNGVAAAIAVAAALALGGAVAALFMARRRPQPSAPAAAAAPAMPKVTADAHA